MDLQIREQLFIVCGASSGFGRSVAEALAKEGAHVVAIARRAEKLEELSLKHPGQVTSVCCDITQQTSVEEIMQTIGDRQVHGVLINAGGPPAKTVLETSLEDWDNAYSSLLRWKVSLTQRLIPKFMENKYGRLVYIESSAVKQPIENLVLSNSLRLAVVGFVKSLSQEIASSGVTLNVLAPGFHATAATDRIFNKKSELEGISKEEAMKQSVNQLPVGVIGNPDDFASLATWLLSPQSRFITGQTISVDGGAIHGVMG